MPSAKRSLNASIVVARAPGTPHRGARAPTQSRSGWPRSSMSSALRPGLPAPTFGELAEQDRVAAVREQEGRHIEPLGAPASTTPCSVYMPLPVALPDRRPCAPGTPRRHRWRPACPCRSSRPCFESQSWGCGRAGRRKRSRGPVVTASSTTIAFSGSSGRERGAERLRRDRPGCRLRRPPVGDRDRGRSARADPRRPRPRARRSGPPRVGPRTWPTASGRRQQARLVGIGEETPPASSSRRG